MFDERNVYVAGRVWDSAPPSAWVANEMRRDTSQLRQNDTFAVMFDTFYDRRNGVSFYTNPLGRARRLRDHQRRQSEQRLEPGLGPPHRPVRGRLDGRNGNPVQIAPVSARTGAGLGRPAATRGTAEERVGVPDAASALARWARRDLSGLRRRDTRWARGAGWQQEPGNQTIWYRRPDDRPQCQSSEERCRGRRFRRRREIRHHAESHG